MRAKYGQLISEASGSIAGTVFTKNQFPCILRTKNGNTNRRTAKQTSTRSNFTDVTMKWRELTQAQRNAWNARKNDFLPSNKFSGQAGTTGFDAFCKVNNMMLTINESIVVNPPAIKPVFNFNSFTFQVDVSSSTITLTYTPAIVAGNKVLVYATHPMSAGIFNHEKYYRLITILTDASISPFNCTSQYKAIFGTVGEIGQKICFKLVPVRNSSGLTGNKIKLCSTIELSTFIIGDTNVYFKQVYGIGDWLRMLPVVPTNTGTVQKYTAYVGGFNGIGGSRFKVALYSNVFNLINNSPSDERIVPPIYQWIELPITGAKPTVNAGTLYYFCIWASAGDATLYVKLDGSALTGHGKVFAYTGVFPPNVIGFSTHPKYFYSLYGTCNF